MSADQIELGEKYTRRQMKALFGGGLYRGIEVCGEDNILIYSDHATGPDHGYRDGWSADVDEYGAVFEYSGEGRFGDQEMKRGNRAILEHEESGRALKVFIADGTVPGGNTKLHRYIGAFELDQAKPYTEEPALDPNGQTRTIFIFRLRPLGEVYRAAIDYMRPATQTSVLTLDMPDTHVPAETTTVETIELEHNSGILITRDAVAPTDMRRIEAALIDRFKTYLGAKGHVVKRDRITIEGVRASFLTDVHDLTDDVLYEAKSAADRNLIRMAIGQLHDYQRQVQASKMAVLLPDEPIPDLRELIESLGMAVVYETEDGFVGCP
jgi:hypothetical protein